jgi:hypothetical protein
MLLIFQKDIPKVSESTLVKWSCLLHLKMNLPETASATDIPPCSFLLLLEGDFTKNHINLQVLKFIDP